MSTRVVHLHIDRIVVEGLPASAQQRFMRALEQGLNGFANDGLAQSGFAGQKPAAQGGITKSRITALDAGQIRSGAGRKATAEQAAGQIVQALQQKLGGARQAVAGSSSADSAAVRTTSAGSGSAHSGSANSSSSRLTAAAPQRRSSSPAPQSGGEGKPRA
jgi:hypothetical protein